MAKKLTLRLDEDLIAYAKEHAKAHDTSVSKLVANYFAALHAYETKESEKEQLGPITRSLGAVPKKEVTDESLPPITRSLVGIASGSTVTEDDYYRYLEEKHR